MKPIQLILRAGVFAVLFLSACQPQNTQVTSTAAAPATAIVATAAIATATTVSAPAVVSSATPTRGLTAVPLMPAAPTEDANMNEVPFPTPLDASTSALVDQARQDLSKRLSLDPSQIELVSASMVTWPDSSLGCPKPGMMYTQSLVDGYRLRLRAGGQIYDYHGGGSRPPFLCEQKP